MAWSWHPIGRAPLVLPAGVVLLGIGLARPVPALAQSVTDSTTGAVDHSMGLPDLSQVVPPAKDAKGVTASLKILVLLTVLSLAPSILIMMTSFTRIVVVLTLLRQALGTQQLPPGQVLIGLAFF